MKPHLPPLPFRLVPLLAVACLSVLVTGCVAIPSPFAHALNPVVKEHSAIKRKMPRSEVETRLGKPTRVQADGACIWETRFDDLNYALLTVWFDHEEKVHRVEGTRAHGKNVVGYHGSATRTWSRE